MGGVCQGTAARVCATDGRRKEGRGGLGGGGGQRACVVCVAEKSIVCRSVGRSRTICLISSCAQRSAKRGRGDARYHNRAPGAARRLRKTRTECSDGRPAVCGGEKQGRASNPISSMRSASSITSTFRPL